MEPRDIRVSSWSELQERLYAESWNDVLRRFRSRYAFRGVPGATDDLSTSLERLADEESARFEMHMLRNFRKYAAQDAAGRPFAGDSTWNWLALAQHHGLPTRLLDWTFSPYVALHFMTQRVDLFHLDGAVWCVDYARAHASLPESLGVALEAEQADVFTAEMLDGAGAASLAQLAEMETARPAGEGTTDGARAGSGEPRTTGADAEGAFVLFIEPPSLDQRIINQFALFSLMSRPVGRLDAWLSRNLDVYQRLIVPAELKWEVRDKLDQANITERVLFPGLDGLSRWLTRYYTPRL